MNNKTRAAATIHLLLLIAACSGNSSPDALERGNSSANSQAPGGGDSIVASATTETHSFTGVAGFETGLVKLATIDGRITSRDEVTINWGDRSASGALFANCALLQPRLNCEIWGSHTYALPGTYTPTVTYTLAAILDRNEETETVSTTARISPVEGLVVVALGDSYYSGEGAPLHTYENIGGDNTGDTALWDEPSLNHYAGTVGPITDSNGNEYFNGDTLKSCHRSPLSGFRLATKSLADNGTPITYINMPCSGAQLGNSYQLDPIAGREPGTVRDTGAYINEQLDWVRTRVPRIDALLVSAGGNNVGFGSTILDCLCFDQLLNGAATCIREDYICSDDGDLQDDVAGYFDNLNGFEFSDGTSIKGEYDLFADDINCRSVEGETSTREPNFGVTLIGTLCADVQFNLGSPLFADGVPVELIDAGYASQNGRVIDTRDAMLETAGGCHRFVIDTNDPAATTLSLTPIDKEDSRCGPFETEFSKSAPFGEILYVRAEFDGWARIPGWSRRFVNLGDGTLQAEFVLPPPEGVEGWRFKIAGMPEYRVPGVTMINHYPDVTRNEHGNTPTDVESALCTGYDIAPREWSFLYELLVDPLYKSITAKAEKYGWKTISVDEFLTHGYCTGPFQRWMVRALESYSWQGDISGSAHPNWEGHEYYSERIRASIINETPPRTTASAEVNGLPYEFGSVTKEDVTVTLNSQLNLTGSGVGATYYGVGADLCTPDTFPFGACTQYTGPFTVSESGINYVSFYATSVTGASEVRVWPETVVIDRDPPVMTCLPEPDMLWPPNGKMVDVRLRVTADDAVAGPVDFELISITDSRNNAAEDVAGFVLNTDDTEGALRSRRAGNEPERVYSFVYQSADPWGNSTTCEAQIVVPHDQGNR